MQPRQERYCSASGMLTKPRLSGIQRDVLSLYRQCLRKIREKPTENQLHFRLFMREEFEKTRNFDKKDFASIEFLLRKGQRQLETYAAPGVKDVRR